MSRYIEADNIRPVLVTIYNAATSRIARKTIEKCDYEFSMIPTADVAPVVHAHWIDKEEEIYGSIPNILRVCSNCDTESDSIFMAACCAFIPSDAFGAGDDTKFPKCPVCGAKMDEDGDDE